MKVLYECLSMLEASPHLHFYIILKTPSFAFFLVVEMLRGSGDSTKIDLAN